MRMMRSVVVAVVVSWASIAGAQSQPAEKSAQLRARVDAEFRRLADAADGVVGYAIVDLTNGDRFERQAAQPFPTASTIKLAVLYELLKQADEKRLRLDEPKPIPPSLRVGGSGVLQQLSNPVLSLRDCAVLMMMASDNTATNLLIDRLGIAEINAAIRAAGLERTELWGRIDSSAFSGDKAGLGVATPGELVRFFRRLRRGELLGTEATERYFDVLRAYGATHVLNQWERMPEIDAQLARAMPLHGGITVIRLLMPVGMKYDDLKQALAPFNRISSPQPRIRDLCVHAIRTAMAAGNEVFVVSSNKVEGCAALTVEAIARQLVAT